MSAQTYGTPRTGVQWVKDIVKAGEAVRTAPEKERPEISKLLYTPDSRLTSLLVELDTLSRSELEGDDLRRGKLLEHICYVIFSSILGCTDQRSYRSAQAQLDLFVTGNDAEWLLVCSHLHLDCSRRGILVEAKAWNGKVGDPEFCRLCSLVSWHFPQTCGLGVLVSLKGATGFPEPPKKSLGLKDARLTQALFHARTSIPVVVLSRSDLDVCTKPGGLLDVLGARIDDIDARSPALHDPGLPAQEALPPHLTNDWA